MTTKRPPGYSKAPPTMPFFWLTYLTASVVIVASFIFIGAWKAAGVLAVVLLGLMYVLRRWGE